MATIASLVIGLNDIKQTPSGLVDWNNNSLQSVMYNGVKALLLERGLMQVADVTELQTVSGAESNAVAIDGTGYFLYSASGSAIPPNSYPAAGGGIWIQQFPADLPTTLAGLSDVTITSPANNQILQYNSSTSKWINSNLATTLAGLTDCLINSQSTGAILAWNGTKWANNNFFIVSAADGSLAINTNNFRVDGITGDGLFGRDLSVTRDLKVNTDKFIARSNGDVLINSGSRYVFTVEGANGNTSIAGTLQAGATTIGNGLIKLLTNGDVIINEAAGYKLTIEGSNGNLATKGGISAIGNYTTVDGDLSTTNGKIVFGGNGFRISGSIAATAGSSAGYMPVTYNGSAYKIQLLDI